MSNIEMADKAEQAKRLCREIRQSGNRGAEEALDGIATVADDLWSDLVRIREDGASVPG